MERRGDKGGRDERWTTCAPSPLCCKCQADPVGEITGHVDRWLSKPHMDIRGWFFSLWAVEGHDKICFCLRSEWGGETTMFGSAGSALEVAGSRPFRYLNNPTRISHFSEPLKWRWSTWGVGWECVSGWRGGEEEWSISTSSSRPADRMAATAAKPSETDRQKSLIRNTGSF